MTWIFTFIGAVAVLILFFVLMFILANICDRQIRCMRKGG